MKPRRDKAAEGARPRVRARCHGARAPIAAAVRELHSDRDTIGVVLLLESEQQVSAKGGGGDTGAPPSPPSPPSEGQRLGYRPRPPAWWELAVVLIALAIELAITAEVARMATAMLAARRRAAGSA